ncbi:MAG: 30S ribosomal protein S8 [Acidobacteriota bacterium]
MSMTDPVADMLTRMRNALSAGHRSTDIPSSKLKVAIARILKDEGFILDFNVVDDRRQGSLNVRFKFAASGESVITGLEKVSKPGCRVYRSAEDIPEVLGGLGINVISTSRGVVSGRTARARRTGGELLVNVW